MELNEGNAWSRIQQFGLKSVTPIDLLVLVLARNEKDGSAVEHEARSLFSKYGLGRLGDLSSMDLKESSGLEPYESTRVLAAIELGRRIAGHGKQEVKSISSPQDSYRLFQYLEKESREHFCAAFLDTKNGVISTRTIHIGTLNMSVVGAREIFREAVRDNAAGVVLAHNHPSGDPQPSPEDIAITKKLRDVGEMLDIAVLDHVIIGSSGKFVSLHQEGIL